MQLLWAASRPLTVADVHARLSREQELAYTTVMTVLDRLSKKHLVHRELDGRAWHYTPRAPQGVIVAEEIGALLAGVSGDTRVAALRHLAQDLSPEERSALRAE